MEIPTNNQSGVILYGAGGHCKVVIDIIDSLGIHIESIVDDNPQNCTPYIKSYKIQSPRNFYKNAIITIGNCNIRKKITNRINVNNYMTVIHPSAVVSPSIRIGVGSVVMQGVIVQADAKVGDHCILNTRASIGHDVELGNFVHIASGAIICGEVEIGECTWIGAGSVIRQGIRIGKNCMIGAGSVVVCDIPDNSVAYGNPCKVKRIQDTIL